MKLKYHLAIAGFAMAMCSCDEGTDKVGMSLTSSNDNINVTTQEFNVLTESFIPDSVYTYNSELYLGRITDPETNTTVANSFMLQFNMMEDRDMPSLKEIISLENGEIVADSCLIYLFFDKNKTFGDSTAAMKLKISELSHPVPDGVHYTNFDPVKEGYIREGGLTKTQMYTYADMSISDSARASSNHVPHIAIRLDKPYTDKNGVTYKNYGTYIIRNFYKHPEYFKNSFAFIHQICPGFYIETTDGEGLMSFFLSAQLITYISFKFDEEDYEDKEEYEEEGLKDKVFVSYLSGSSTNEVLQTITVKNDKAALKNLVESNLDYTYLKTPVGIFTEVTFPVDEIKTSHVKDSLLSVSVSFPRVNNLEPLTNYTFSAPKKVLLIQKDSLNSFFEKNQNYNNKYAFYTTLNKNAYSFSGSSDINTLIVKMYNDRQKGLKHDPNWVEKHPNWNKALLVPVGEISISSSSSSTSGTTIALMHEMGVSTTRMKRGTLSDPIKLRVIYANFSN